ncbi:O-methylsterigmatocystin oxidoreductase [Trametes pubescens]|uniref:O-methylsterigmatocystin oxidoreductase n=1 Tax=Trametes pubescens TaxID=154538 RepID=A0A1M2V4R1_TRAPU|nr:O-methylsterigmatocystin oxidoreductase [Trametes pubescens]
MSDVHSLTNPVKYLPTWLPGTGFRRKAAAWKAQIEKCTDEPFEWVKECMRSGTATPCYCTRLLDEETGAGAVDKQYEADIKWTAQAMYLASIDTTLALLTHFVLAMVRKPEVVLNAQEEIDSVTGGSRLPTYDDRGALPYVNAIMSEYIQGSHTKLQKTTYMKAWLSLRARSSLPIYGKSFPYIAACLSHTVLTTAFCVNRKTTRDPTLFPDPESFLPERYLDDVDEATARLRDPWNYIFGFGRRKCIGTHLVDSYLWLAIACMLATFDFAKATDADGNVIEPHPEYNDPSFRYVHVANAKIASE